MKQPATRRRPHAHELINYICSLKRFGIRPRLEATSELLTTVGNPHLSMQYVHVTGTNGKGSVCAMLDSVLRHAGHCVGLYTSPHLENFNERIKVDGVDISDDDLERLAIILMQRAAAASLEPTFFEFTTALAFLYFAEKGVAIGVIEVGLGGRLDSTNVILPLVCVITNIGPDHLEILGDSLEKIAHEKAGIIKPGCIAVIGEKVETLRQIFRTTCRERNAVARIVGNEATARLASSNLAHQQFAVDGTMPGSYELSLLGTHQLDNALCALVAIDALRSKGIVVSDDAVRKGLATTHWPGRLQIVKKRPLLVFDGAHNQPGMEALTAYAQRLPRREVLVIALKEDKDSPGMLSLIAPLFKHVICTEGNYKPRPAALVCQEAARHCSDAVAEPDVTKALALAEEKAGAEGTILVTGSLYMIGDALKAVHIKRKRVVSAATETVAVFSS